MKRKFMIFPALAALASVLMTPALADGPTAITTVNEYGYEATVITDENGNTMVFEYVDDNGELHDEVSMNWDDDGEPTAPSAQTGGGAGTSGGTVSGVGSTTVVSGGGTTVVSDGTSAIISESEPTIVTADNDGANIVTGTIPENSIPLTERIADALPESIQQALSTGTDENGEPVVNSGIVILLLVIILVLLLVIIAGIVLAIVLVLNKRKKEPNPAEGKAEE